MRNTVSNSDTYSTKIWGVFPYFDIVDPLDGQVYLRRIVLLRLFGCALMLHRIYRPDHSRELHNHPWRFATLILWGGYTEVILDWVAVTEHGITRSYVIQTRKPGRIYFHGDLFQHRIAELPNGTATTLVFRLPRFREWGFFTTCGFQDWRTYCEKLYKGAPICEEKDGKL